jgi:hypothetical protein
MSEVHSGAVGWLSLAAAPRHDLHPARFRITCSSEWLSGCHGCRSRAALAQDKDVAFGSFASYLVQSTSLCRSAVLPKPDARSRQWRVSRWASSGR